ncbi:MAG: aminodeoxychorismate/anthranilate synthase component II [Candidatus Delongbacteria bacterium]|jgi:anthranilate synthase component 2|nr:aminodeoxychorismate/anthranilate synthase component II [Candidatus Delongbacteria bacterium]
MKNCLLIDCYDSFSYKLAQTVRQTGMCDVDVMTYDDVEPLVSRLYDAIVISPGPGLPYEYPKLFRMLSELKRKPVLGVCLGHQMMALYCGGQLAHLPEVVHGQKKALIACNDDVLFKGVSTNIEVGLYHSWVIESVPSQIHITAKTEEGVIMAYRHETYPWTGVQFHPESYMTKDGIKMLSNWINSVL